MSRNANINVNINSNMTRHLTGCIGWSEKTIRNQIWQCAFYLTGEHVRLTKNGKPVEWDKASAAARKWAYECAAFIKSMMEQTP